MVEADAPLRPRCAWARTALSIAYHNEEWGVPVHDDYLLFEFLVLEGAQAGLSWETILAKRDRPERVAAYDEGDVARLLADPGIVRNRAKIASAIRNARALLAVRDEHGSFDAYVWQLAGGRPVANAWRSPADVPATTPAAEAMSRDLKRRGFTFVGPTICYAFMQATGMVNDHTVDCFRHAEIAAAAADAVLPSPPVGATPRP